MRFRVYRKCLSVIAFLCLWALSGSAGAANMTVKETALEAGCKATTVTVVQQETGDAPQTIYNVACQTDDGKPHSVLITCELDQCSVLH